MRKFAKAYHDILYNGELSPCERLILIHLGEIQGKNDASWYTQQSIADALKISRKHVNLCLAKLEKLELISINRTRERLFYTVNNVTIRGNVTNEDSVTNTHSVTNGYKAVLQMVTPLYIDKPDQINQTNFNLSDLPKTGIEKPTSPPPLVSPKNPPPPKTTPDWTGRQTEQAKLAQQQADFAELWAAYPRGRGEIGSKKVALEKYTRALKKASHETIMQGIQRYKNYLETVDRPPNAAHVATFLFQERWENEYETATSQAEETQAERGARLRAEFALKKQLTAAGIQ